MRAKNIFFLIVFRHLMRDQENITSIDQFVIDYVRELRFRKGLTQEDIANVLSVSRSFIRNIESINSRNKYNIRHINALADYFGMSPRAFLPEKAFPVDAVEREKMPVKKSSRQPKKSASKKKRPIDR
jgi:transcriptional regulator with XRE-family HTH domain